MRALRGLAIIPLAALLLAACGDDDSDDKSTDTVAANPSTPAETTPATNATTEPTEVSLPSSVRIDVTIGVDSGSDRIETVAVGTEVTLSISSPDADDEIHVHVVDLEQEVAAGESVSFTFVVDTVGEIEVESHLTGDVFVVIEVV